INVVSASYFSVIELPIVRGRTFDDAEIANGGAIIVTESTARRLWPDRDPIGQTLTQGAPGPAGGSLGIIELRVVGVAKDAQITGIGEPPPSNIVYLPATPGPGNLQLLAKSGVDFASTAAAIRTAFAEIDP